MNGMLYLPVDRQTLRVPRAMVRTFAASDSSSRSSSDSGFAGDWGLDFGDVSLHDTPLTAAVGSKILGSLSCMEVAP